LDAVGRDPVDAVEEPVDLGPPAAAAQPAELLGDLLGAGPGCSTSKRRTHASATVASGSASCSR
jgi:hypothetical protein